MRVKDLAGDELFSAVTLPDGDREIDGVYIGDLLSWVMGRAQSGNVWVTIMSNINILAVASLSDTSCIILAEGVTVDEEVIKTALEKEINILSTYMIVEWFGQQLASIEVTRMKFSGTDFKFTSQANHMQKLLAMKKDYEREGFHLQRLYKRRKIDKDGRIVSTFGQLAEKSVADLPDIDWRRTPHAPKI